MGVMPSKHARKNNVKTTTSNFDVKSSVSIFDRTMCAEFSASLIIFWTNSVILPS